MDKKRVSTRITNQEYLFANAMASADGESLSSYFHKKLFEPKVKMSKEQFEQMMKQFTKRVDVLVMLRIENGIFSLLKRVQMTGQFTDDDRSIMLDIQHDVKEVKKGIDILCRHCL